MILVTKIHPQGKPVCLTSYHFIPLDSVVTYLLSPYALYVRRASINHLNNKQATMEFPSLTISPFYSFLLSFSPPFHSLFRLTSQFHGAIA